MLGVTLRDEHLGDRLKWAPLCLWSQMDLGRHLISAIYKKHVTLGKSLDFPKAYVLTKWHRVMRTARGHVQSPLQTSQMGSPPGLTTVPKRAITF